MAKRSGDAVVVEYDSTGDVDVLQVRTRPQAPPGPGEVLVDVVTSGISHIDGFIRGGAEEAFAEDPFPRGSGSDFAGIVAAVGEGVQGFRRGADVIGHVRVGRSCLGGDRARCGPRAQAPQHPVGSGRGALPRGRDRPGHARPAAHRLAATPS